jgi:hypothetical protein
MDSSLKKFAPWSVNPDVDKPLSLSLFGHRFATGRY